MRTGVGGRERLCVLAVAACCWLMAFCSAAWADAPDTITTIAGAGVGGSTAEGVAATSASLNNPKGLVFDAAGNMLVADSNAHRVRLVAAAAAASTLQVPRNVHIGHRVTMYASGRVARDVRRGDKLVLYVAPTADRGAPGAFPKFKTTRVGRRLRVVFRWPASYEHCTTSRDCTQTSWQPGSRADIQLCATNRMDVVEACASSTTVVRR